MVYKTTSVADGDAALIINTQTIDGRDIDKNGITENALSDGAGLIHSNVDPELKIEYKTINSKQCFILKKEQNEAFFKTLKDWGVEDDSIVKGTVFDTDRRDR